jgi:uncharacterized membrane protein
VNRRSLLSALCLLGGAALIALGWWDYQNPDVINQWWAGERVYAFYWGRLARTLAIVLPLALLAWWLGVQVRAALAGDARPPQRRRQAAYAFAAAFAIPFILVFKYRVTWLGMNYGSSIWTYAFILVLSAIATWLVWPLLRRQQLLTWFDSQGPIIILTGVVIFIIVYGGLAIARQVSFRTGALELGRVDQTIWNTSRGRLFEYTPTPLTFDDDAPDLSPRSRLTDGRLELILIPLSALYWPWANPIWLIALQAITLASGAIPLYLLARNRLGDGTAALAIALAYLLYLPLHHIVLAGFSPTALMIPFLLWAWEAAEEGHWRSYYLAAIIALLCGIDAALALLGVGLYFLLRGRAYRLHGGAIIFLGLVWLGLNSGVVMPWVGSVYVLGEDAPDVLAAAISHPPEALAQIKSRLFGRETIQVLVDLVASLGWTSLLGPFALLPAALVLIYESLAASPNQGGFLAHDVAPLIPFVFIAAVLGALNTGRWITRLARRAKGLELPAAEGVRLTALFALTTTFAVGLFFSPAPPGWGYRLSHHFQFDEHQKALARTQDLIPAEAVVSAQSHLYPHLSRRPVIYLFPTIADAEYVALDLDYSADKTPLDEDLFVPTVEGLLANPDFHIVAFDDGALILQRSPGEAPAGFTETLADYRGGLYRSAIVEYRGPTRLKADRMYEAGIVLENRGTQSWETIGPYPISLNYHWWTADGISVEWFGLPTPLNRAVKPGDVHLQVARFVTPTEPGDYVLEWDLLHEGRTWFGDQGSITLPVEVTVE